MIVKGILDLHKGDVSVSSGSITHTSVYVFVCLRNIYVYMSKHVHFMKSIHSMYKFMCRMSENGMCESVN
jgi:hypothetical protein